MSVDFNQANYVQLCIDIVEIWFEMLIGKFRQLLTELFRLNMSIFLVPDDNFSKYKGFSPNLVCAMILWRS